MAGSRAPEGAGVSRDAVACAIVGGGFAGMIAARRLQTLGVQPVVLERGEAEGGSSNARISRGVMHIGYGPLDDAPEEIFARIVRATDGEADEAVARAVAAEAGSAARWLAAQGIDVGPSSAEPVGRFSLLPVRPGGGRRIVAEHGSNRAILALYRAVREAGGAIVLGAEAHSLRREGTAWRVAYRRGGDEASVLARAVLVCDGGFAADPDMLARHVGPAAPRCLLRALPSSTGAGLRMLADQGAALAGLGRVYGHMVSRTALTNEALWPYPALDDLCIRALLVDRHGDRYAVSASNGVHLVNRIVTTDDPTGYTLVCDEATWDTLGRDAHLDRPYAPNPALVQLGGDYATAPTLAVLAQHLGMNPERLARAIDAHNADASRAPIARPPFHAMGVTPGITMTLGGPRVDAGARVIDGKGVPIPGLYAAGQSAGGLQGSPHGGYVGGLACALALGYIAAGSIASREQ